MSDKSISGLTQQQGNDGMPIADIPGDGGLGPDTAVIIAGATGLPISDPSISIQLFPSGAFATGTDSLGQISVVKTFSNSGDDKNFFLSGGGTSFLPDGFYASDIRVVVNHVDAVIDITIQFLFPPVGDFGPSATAPPEPPTAENAAWDAESETGSVDIIFTYTNEDTFDPIGLVVLADGVPSVSVPFESGITEYTVRATVFTEGVYDFTVAAYKYTTSEITAESAAVSVSLTGADPDLSVTGSGGFSVGGSALIVFSTDASGIYTLAKNKRNDTLYDRETGLTTDVKIPDPLARIGYIP